jgi:hypothetical protein
MPTFGFIAGALTSLAATALLAPWLRRIPQLARLTATPLRAAACAAAFAAMIALLYALRPSPPAVATTATAAAPTPGSFGAAARLFDSAAPTAAPGVVGADAGAPAVKAGASSMENAIANLEKRLAQGGGSADDWELLAKSFEFLDHPADAARARAHQLPVVEQTGKSAAPEPSAPGTAASGSVTISGEVTLDSALDGKAAPGDTLFIVAKSIADPGIPVAVSRLSVAAWPLKFTLDDAQSMVPGRTLSTAGRVTIEARISRSGQPLPTAGDLQGTSGAINPADRKPLRIRIDRVVP